MNKFGVVLGVAAVATLAGCKDPDYVYEKSSASQNEVKDVDTTQVAPAPAPQCKCAPGTKHASPCLCGAPDCLCAVESKPIEPIAKPLPMPVVQAPKAPEQTTYVVQSGDCLSKIAVKYGVSVSSIKSLNPSIKRDVIRVGQKLKLPGKLDIQQNSSRKAGGAVTGVKGTAKGGKAAAPVKKAAKGTTSYTGATKEYVVKNGDTLGSIAYGNGINIRQLKELNGITKSSLKVGQKLKIPAEKVTKAAPKAAEKPEAPAAEKPVAPVAPEAPADATTAPAPQTEATAPQASAPAAAPAAAEPAAKTETTPATTTYVVQDGDDMTGVSIRWGVSAAQIRELNNLSESDQLVPGQIIKLPAEAQQ